MAVVKIKCRYCGGDEVCKAGITANGTQRFRCRTCKRYFQLEYLYNGHKPGIADTIVEMAMNGSGIRDTSRTVNNTRKVIHFFRKAATEK